MRTVLSVGAVIWRLAIFVGAAFGLGLPVDAAQATFPGQNGPIAFRSFDPATGAFPLLRANSDGTDVTVLTELPGLFSDWSPGGRKIAFDFFDAQGNEQIATADADGGNAQVITSGTGLAINEVPSWSPDGTRILFDGSGQSPDAPDFRTSLWTINADGTDPQLFPITNPGFDVEPKYSPDGRWIAFDRIRPAAGHRFQHQAVFIVSSAGGTARQLTAWGLAAEHPTWSPDSQWIAFDTASGAPGPETIEIMHPDGHGKTVILPGSARIGGHKPWFSPDGKKILFGCVFKTRGFIEDICVMDTDGTHIVDLTNTPDMPENWPSWGPAPSS
jgi:Tol biopolymer transport system component